MTAHLITSMRVRGLFGLYDYDLPASGDFLNATILYGDNGVGKTTLLKLAFHLVSAANNKGHKNALYQAPFRKLEVDLKTGVTLGAEIIDNSSRILRLTIVKTNKIVATWDFKPNLYRTNVDIIDDSFIETLNVTSNYTLHRTSNKDSYRKSRQNYFELLSEFAPTVFFLNAERHLDGDTVSNPSDEVELRRMLRFEEPKTINELSKRTKEIALSQALGSATTWVRNNVFASAGKGSTNVHSVYLDALNKISSPKTRQSTEENVAAELLEDLQLIDQKTGEHQRYELAPELSTTELRKALSPKNKKPDDLV